MHAFIWRISNSGATLKYQSKYFVSKIRKFSQKLNTPAAITRESSEKQEDKSSAWTRNDKNGVDKTEVVKDSLQQENKIKVDTEQKYFILQNKIANNQNKKFKRKLCNSAIINSKIKSPDNSTKSTKSKFLKPKIRKINEGCNVLNKESNISRPIVPSFPKKIKKDPCGSNTKSNNDIKKSKKSSNLMKTKELNSKTDLTDEKSFKKSTVNEEINKIKIKEELIDKSKNLKMKSKEIKNLKNDKLSLNELTLMTKEHNDNNNRTLNKTGRTTVDLIKLDDLLKDDINWAKDKITEMKNNDAIPVYLKQSVNNKTQSNTINYREISNNELEIEKLNLNRKNFEKDKQYEQKRNQNIANDRDQVIMNITSMPLKLTSKEMLYTGKRKTNEDAKSDLDRKSVKQMQENKILQMKRKIYSANIQAKTKLNHLKFNRNNFQVNTYQKNDKRNTNTQINKYFKDLKSLANKKPLDKTNETINAAIKKHPIVKSKSANELNKMNLIDNRKSIRDHTGNVWQYKVNKQMNTDKIWFNKDIKQRKLKAKQLMNTSKKKPVFLGKNTPTLSLYRIKNGSNVNQKNCKPVFGPPVDDSSNKHDEELCLSVVNTDTCLAAADQTQENTVSKPTSLFAIENNKTIVHLKRIIQYLANIMHESYREIVKIVGNIQKVRGGNQPRDNLNVSVLVTQKQKQPIYICDNCSYLLKRPTIYQRLNARIDNFAHLIKTKRSIDDKANSIPPALSLVTNKPTSADNEPEQCCQSKSETVANTKVLINSTNPKQSYADILGNLLSDHQRQRSTTKY
ncbi:hypothetical protein O3M35_000160 [Rhynocoris fuscipes]|uniref:Uncharacterized protein n=1 Tax=Rhynocoris fuscipes TaxID=488301 RepID=A0AAW1DKG0_9HEMI